MSLGGAFEMKKRKRERANWKAIVILGDSASVARLLKYIYFIFKRNEMRRCVVKNY